MIFNVPYIMHIFYIFLIIFLYLLSIDLNALRLNFLILKIYFVIFYSACSNVYFILVNFFHLSSFCVNVQY